LKDTLAPLGTLRRPGLLVRAARHAMQDYVRQRDLDRLLPLADPAVSADVFSALLAAEAGLERTRRAGLMSYSVSRHIEVMSALMAEARSGAPPPGPAA
jgi:Family of unknown function (DUF6477)